jgi:DNA anti-recombination protein RmuC
LQDCRAGWHDAQVSFNEQVSGETGKSDVVVYLPNQGYLPIDAKLRLNAFLDAMTATDTALRRNNSRCVMAMVNKSGITVTIKLIRQGPKSPGRTVANP